MVLVVAVTLFSTVESTYCASEHLNSCIEEDCGCVHQTVPTTSFVSLPSFVVHHVDIPTPQVLCLWETEPPVPPPNA
jgi:hypothetical protein